MAEGVAFASGTEGLPTSCCFPGVAVTPEGRWIVSCRIAPTKTGMRHQSVAVRWSDDQGLIWSPWSQPWRAPTRAGRAGSWRGVYLTALGVRGVLAALYWVDATDPARPFYNEQTQGILDAAIYWSRSRDGGVTWSAPCEVPTPYRQPTPITGPILVTADGAWLAQFELAKPWDDVANAWHCQACVAISRDAGTTWPRVSVTAHDPQNRMFYWDQRPCVLHDTRLLAMFWTYDTRTNRYLNIHAAWSHDHGITWSAPRDTGVPGQPAPVVSFQDGRLIMVYVDRTAAPRIMARISTDGGRTWPPASQALLHDRRLAGQAGTCRNLNETWAEFERFSVGLPATAAIPGDEVLAVYYSGDQADATSIHWTRFRVTRSIGDIGSEGA